MNAVLAIAEPREIIKNLLKTIEDRRGWKYPIAAQWFIDEALAVEVPAADGHDQWAWRCKLTDNTVVAGPQSTVPKGSRQHEHRQYACRDDRLPPSCGTGVRKREERHCGCRQYGKTCQPDGQHPQGRRESATSHKVAEWHGRRGKGIELDTWVHNRSRYQPDSKPKAGGECHRQRDRSHDHLAGKTCPMGIRFQLLAHNPPRIAFHAISMATTRRMITNKRRSGVTGT